MIPDYELQQILDRDSPNKLIVRRLSANVVETGRRNEDCSICDFCGLDMGEGKDYPADDIEIVVMHEGGKSEAQWSIGAWGACLRCSLLIDAGKRDSLLDRAKTTSRKKDSQRFPEVSEHNRRELRKLGDLMLSAAHDAFWRAKK